jgi:phenylacetate-CoA ligase
MLLRHAYENVPYYHKSFKKENLQPSDIKSLKDLHRIPILRRSAVRDRLDEMIARGAWRKEIIPFFTSGTTAAPVKFYRTKTDLSWAYAAELRAFSWAGYELGDKRALIWQFEPGQTKSFEFTLQNLLRRDYVLNVINISEKTMESFARKMAIIKPSFIRGYGGSTNLFATFLLQNGKLRINPVSVSTSATTLLPHYRKTIEKAFSCKVYDFYGSREISSIAAQCGHHEGLHVTEENVILEIVKEDEPVALGEEGQILLTNLHSHAMPFIRYDIGDTGKIFPETCSCGRELSLMKPIGRTYERFANSDGSFTTLRDFQTVFENLPIKEFQVVQESFDEIVIKIVSLDGYTSAHTDFILKNIKMRGKAKIRVELVDSIPTKKSGKTQYVISKLASKYI